MSTGYPTMLWLKARHLRADLNFWLWAAGADLDGARDLSERIYLLYLILIVCGCVGACWTWVLGLVTGTAATGDIGLAAITAELSPLAAGLLLALPACAGTLWCVRAAWRAPWTPQAPDAAWLAQTPVPLASWSTVELMPRLAVRGALAGAAGYLVAAFTHAATGDAAGLAGCLPYAILLGLMTGAAYALAWLVGELRLRAGRERRLPLTGIVLIAGAALIAVAFTALPRLIDLARGVLAGELAAPALAGAACTLVLLAAGTILAARRLPACSLVREAADASVYATRRMAIYDPKAHRALIRSRRAAGRKPFGRMPKAYGTAAPLARAAISTVRRFDALPDLFAAGAILAPTGAALLSGSFAEASAALGLLGGAAGGRVLGAACWILFALNASELPRAIARVFTDDMANRFMRDHLPIGTARLFFLGAAPSLAVALAGSALVCALWGIAAGPAAGASLFAGCAALDIILAICGGIGATARPGARRQPSCEAELTVAAALAAIACAAIPAPYAPVAFWAVTALCALDLCRRARILDAA